jgi:enoyl-CoA hydratase/carnithine racemase
MFETVDYQINKNVAIVRMNRPEALNLKEFPVCLQRGFPY